MRSRPILFLSALLLLTASLAMAAAPGGVELSRDWRRALFG